jgi:hypothetical protein
MFASENFLLTFSITPNNLPSLGGREGRGGGTRGSLSCPPLPSPLTKGRGIGGETSNMLGYNLKGIRIEIIPK